MDIVLTILYLHPTLEFGIDFKVTNDGQGGGDIITWMNTEITQPTLVELQTAWDALQSEKSLKSKMNRLYDIDTELKKLNAPGITIVKQSIIDLNNVKIAELNAESDAIQTDIGDNYDTSLVDDIYTSLFL